MYARNVTVRIKSEQLDEAIQTWKDTVAPSVRQQKGLVSVHLLVDRANSSLRSIGFWETEADLQGSVRWNQGQLDKFTTFFAAPPVVELFEVAAGA